MDKKWFIETDKTWGDELFQGFRVIYILPTLTISYNESLFESQKIYVELTWIKWIVRVIIYRYADSKEKRVPESSFGDGLL